MVCGASYPGGQSASSLALCSMIARMVSSVSASPKKIGSNTEQLVSIIAPPRPIPRIISQPASAPPIEIANNSGRSRPSRRNAPPLDREAVGLLGLAPGLEELAILEPAEGGADRLEETADRADDPHIRTA